MSIQDQQETGCETAEMEARYAGAGRAKGKKMPSSTAIIPSLISSRAATAHWTSAPSWERWSLRQQSNSQPIRRDEFTAQKMLIQDVAIDTLLLLALQARLDVAPIRKGRINPVANCVPS